MAASGRGRAVREHRDRGREGPRHLRAGASGAWGRRRPPSAWSATRCGRTSPRCWSSAAPGIHVPYHVTWALETAEICRGVHPRLARSTGIRRRRPPSTAWRPRDRARERRLARCCGARRVAMTRALLRALLGRAGGRGGVTGDGRLVRGCNVENASYGVTLCAECGLVSDLASSGGGRAGGRGDRGRRRAAAGALRALPAGAVRARRAGPAGGRRARAPSRRPWATCCRTPSAPTTWSARAGR